MRVPSILATVLALLAGCTAEQGPSADRPADTGAPTSPPAMNEPESRSTPRSRAPDSGEASPEKIEKIEKTEAEWREQLTPEQYHVTREAGTERAFTGRYWDTKTPGTYRCIGCGLPLFDSSTKFESGTGWPSFYRPIGDRYVARERDMKLGYPRTEVTCARCDAHLGHVFDDGPAPTGLRYCINSAALDLDPRDGGSGSKK